MKFKDFLAEVIDLSNFNNAQYGTSNDLDSLKLSCEYDPNGYFKIVGTSKPLRDFLESKGIDLEFVLAPLPDGSDSWFYKVSEPQDGDVGYAGFLSEYQGVLNRHSIALALQQEVCQDFMRLYPKELLEVKQKCFMCYDSVVGRYQVVITSDQPLDQVSSKLKNASVACESYTFLDEGKTSPEYRIDIFATSLTEEAMRKLKESLNPYTSVIKLLYGPGIFDSRVPPACGFGLAFEPKGPDGMQDYDLNR